jgi:hypothetical protein
VLIKDGGVIGRFRSAWRGRRARNLRSGVFQRYGRAMGWVWDDNRGRLMGEVNGWPVAAYEEPDGSSAIVLHSPAAMSPLLVRPLGRGPLPALEMDGLVPLMTGDADFDAAYQVRAAEPWFAMLVLTGPVRGALLAAPAQQWSTDGYDLVSLAPRPRDPLDLLARMSALTVVLESVPWEAYSDSAVPPGRSAVAAALDLREVRLQQRSEAALAQPD